MPEVTSANIGTTRPGPVRSSQSLAGILLIALAAPPSRSGSPGSRPGHAQRHGSGDAAALARHRRRPVRSRPSGLRLHQGGRCPGALGPARPGLRHRRHRCLRADHPALLLRRRAGHAGPRPALRRAARHHPRRLRHPEARLRDLVSWPSASPPSAWCCSATSNLPIPVFPQALTSSFPPTGRRRRCCAPPPASWPPPQSFCFSPPATAVRPRLTWPITAGGSDG